MSISRLVGVLRAASTGAAAGLAGGMVMLVGERIEQAITGRPNSFVPARALLTLVGQRPSDAAKPVVWNHVMHFGTAATLGAVRGVWAATGIRGAYANVSHTVLRLAFDQTVENATGVGAPPDNWPARELIADVLHKALFSATTGVIADHTVPPVLASRRGRDSH